MAKKKEKKKSEDLLDSKDESKSEEKPYKIEFGKALEEIIKKGKYKKK